MGRGKRPRTRRMGKKLKLIRLHLGLTQEEMSKRLKFRTVYASSICEYESNKREPPYPVLLQYARIAECSTDTLIDDTLHL